MSKVINWASGVNKRILDATSFTVGQDGYEEDKSSSGNYKERRLSSLFVPDVFNVQMDFSYIEKRNDNGKLIPETDPGWDDALSEYDRFIKWYKFDHQRGTNPFLFPSITKFNVNDTDKNRPLCRYRITSAITPVKSGFCMRVSMTWEEVFSGVIEIIEQNQALDTITTQNTSKKGLLIATYNAVVGASDCVLDYCTLELKKQEDASYAEIEIKKVDFQGKTAYITFDLPTAAGNYWLRFTDGVSEKKTTTFTIEEKE